MIVVSDTTPLHYLILCEVVEVLPRIFSKVLVPPAVYAELSHPHAPMPVKKWRSTAPEWLIVQAPQAIDSSLNLDRGEVEAISLAEEVGASLILMDDLKGRSAARKRGLRVAGTVGILELAARRGMIDLESVLAMLESTNARLDSELLREALKRSKPS